MYLSSGKSAFCKIPSKHVYETGLNRPVKLEVIDTYLRGGNSCTIKISWE